MAHRLLFGLSRNLEELFPLSNDFEKQFYHLTIIKLAAMRNSIDGDDKFFNLYFKDKTKEEIIQWIEKESKKW